MPERAVLLEWAVMRTPVPKALAFNANAPRNSRTGAAALLSPEKADNAGSMIMRPGFILAAAIHRSDQPESGPGGAL